MRTNLDHALDYLKRGWSVFPVWPGTKRPMLSAWAPFQTRHASEAQVRQWWTDTPDANIAIVTGRISGLVVVDVDPEHGGDRAGLPPTGCVQVTRHGGTQHFYAYPDGVDRVPNQVDVAGSGRDVRGDGGYVVAPPSIVPADAGVSGPGVYAWETFSPGTLGHAPDWALSPPATPETTEPTTDRWLDGLLRNGAKPGERNTSLVRMAGYFAKLNVPMDAALTLAHQWSDRLNSPLPKDEVDVTVRSAYKMERRRSRERGPKVVDDVLLPMARLEDYMARHGDVDVKWTIQDWLPQGTIAFLISPPQSYKTFITFDLAVSVASGRPFLGQFPVHDSGPVGIFQQEDPHSNIAERTSVIAYERLGLDHPTMEDDGTLVMPSITMENLPLYYHEDRRLRFDDQEVMDALEAWVAKVHPKLVIIDPLYSAVDTANDEYMAKAARKMMRLKDIRDKYGTTFVVVHHSNKSMDTWDRQKVWGSQFINAFIETSWLMRKPPDEDATVIKRHFKVAGGMPFVKVTFDMKTDESPYHYHTKTVVVSADEAERVVKNRSAKPGSDRPNSAEGPIMGFLAGGPATLEAVAAALDMPPVDVQKVLRGLLGKHRVRMDAVGKWESLDVDLLG